MLPRRRRLQLQWGPKRFAECLRSITGLVMIGDWFDDWDTNAKDASVTYQGPPCTPQSQTSLLRPPPRTGEQPEPPAAPRTLSAFRGGPDLWT